MLLAEKLRKGEVGKDCRVNTASVAEDTLQIRRARDSRSTNRNRFSNFLPPEIAGPAKFMARNMQYHRRENRIHIREAHAGRPAARRDWRVRRVVSSGVG